MNVQPPKIERHGRFDVVRDDLLPGGTKSRYVVSLLEEGLEIVYASPAQGAAQIALAITSTQLGKRCTIFVARRAKRHANTDAAENFGAEIREVPPPAFLSVVQKRAADYAAQEGSGRVLAPFGLRIPEAATCLREACSAIAYEYDEVWCAAGSGTLAAALSVAFPSAKIFAVSVGHKIKNGEAGRAKVIVYGRPFSRPANDVPPFPSNLTFDAKAWEIMRKTSHGKRVLFWNVDKDHG